MSVPAFSFAVAAPAIPGEPDLAGLTNLAAQPIREVKPPVAMPSEFSWVWLWPLLAAVAFGLALYLWRRKRPKFVQSGKPRPGAPPHMAALRELEEAMRYLGKPKVFCTAVSGAMREYLERQFELPAPWRTTEEFLVELERSLLLTDRHKDQIGRLLVSCDLVKFARHEPGRADLRELQAAAVRLVRETYAARRPPPQETEPAPSADQSGS